MVALNRLAPRKQLEASIVQGSQHAPLRPFSACYGINLEEFEKRFNVKILRQGWATLDFSDAAELAQLRRLHETLQLEIIAVLESLNQLRESPDYELCQLSEQKPGVLDELAAERKKLLEKESAELEEQADQKPENRPQSPEGPPK